MTSLPQVENTSTRSPGRSRPTARLAGTLRATSRVSSPSIGTTVAETLRNSPASHRGSDLAPDGSVDGAEQPAHLPGELDGHERDVARPDGLAGGEVPGGDQDLDGVVRGGVGVGEEGADGGEGHQQAADDGAARGQADPSLDAPGGVARLAGGPPVPPGEGCGHGLPFRWPVVVLLPRPAGRLSTVSRQDGGCDERDEPTSETVPREGSAVPREATRSVEMLARSRRSRYGRTSRPVRAAREQRCP